MDTERIRVADRDVSIVRVIGEVDVATAAAFRTAVMEALTAEPGALVVDFTGCTFNDTSIVRPIAAACRELRGRQGRFAAVASTSPNVRRVLELAGLVPAIDVFPGTRDALDSLIAS